MTTKSRRFAVLLQAIQSEEAALAIYKADHKSRMETLRDELNKLKMEELTGQLSLVPDPPDDGAELEPAGD